MDTRLRYTCAMKDSRSSITVIAHDMRSCHNVGALLRTAEGLGIDKVYLTGYTPYPRRANDNRLPHLARKLHNQIHKTALGAEDSQAWEHQADLKMVISRLRSEGFVIAALEQTVNSLPLPSFQAPEHLCLVLGTEVTGLSSEQLDLTDIALEIPMKGKKESFNVVQAAAMALYHLTFNVRGE